METVIKISPSELNPGLLSKIQEFIGNKKNIDITISLKEFDPDFADTISRSVDQAEHGDIITFTMEEFVAYNPRKKQ